MFDLTRLGWAQEDHAFLQLWASRFQPGGTLEHRRSWCEQMRAATSADTAVRLFQIGGDIDVREAARKIKCPVLIVHPERDVNVPIEEGRLLASLIPHCRFVQLDTENHMPLADEPAWEKLVAEVRSFLAQPEGALSNGHKCLPLGTLTPRERAVLEGIAEGLDNAEIAGSLQLSEKTVRNHITRVFDKICVEHRYQAIVLAREAGLGRAGRLVQPALIRDICPWMLVAAPRPRRDTGLNTTAFARLRVLTARASHALARMPREARRRGRRATGETQYHPLCAGRSIEPLVAEREENIMHANIRSTLLAAALTAAASPAFANVITDWDEKAVAAVTPMSSLGGTSPYMAASG